MQLLVDELNLKLKIKRNTLRGSLTHVSAYSTCANGSVKKLDNLSIKATMRPRYLALHKDSNACQGSARVTAPCEVADRVVNCYVWLSNNCLHLSIDLIKYWTIANEQDFHCTPVHFTFRKIVS